MTKTKTVTIDQAIKTLQKAREKIGGDKALILSLTGSGIEDTAVNELGIVCDDASTYVAVMVKHPSLPEGDVAAVPNTRGMGDVQWSVLRSLAQHKSWWPGCGWLWDTRKGTIKLMETLVKRGLAIKQHKGSPVGTHLLTSDVYRPSAAAEDVLVKKGLLKAS